MTQAPTGPSSSRRFRWARLGDYEVIEPLGEGAMGIVLRALDTRLGRHVALKLLPERVTGDADWLARFEREARVLASLNHPNVATLFGFEEANAVPAPATTGDGAEAVPARQRFLVMEVVEGETLADRLKRGPLPLVECLEVFLQIAHGLDAAHEKGVVHRDLKPANVKVGAGDRVKILDFGLAKAAIGASSGPTGSGGSGGSSDASESPTLLLAATQRGEILGTAAYMSPEQARGAAVDKRTDVWAFGCCLYEALVGRPVFEGDSVADILASVLREDPDWKALQGRTPARLERLLRRCLEKKASRRLRDIGDAAIEIEDLLRDPSAGETRIVAAPAPPGPTRKRALGLALAAAVIALPIGFLAGSALRRAPAAPAFSAVRRFTETLPAARGASIHSLAISDDGRFLAIASPDPGRPLWFRRLDQTSIDTIAGTEQGEFPFFSPDGEWIAFFTGFENALKKVPTRGGGQVVTLASGLRRNWGGSWGTDGNIVFHSQSGGDGLSRVSERGGPIEVLTEPAEGENSHRWPQVLPGGAGVVFTVWKGSADASEIAYLSLRSKERRTLVPGTFARYLPTGHLVYFVESRMMAVPFDVDSGVVTGPSVPVQSVESAGPWGYRTIATTPDGLQVQALRPPSRLLWVARDGTESEIALPRGSYRTPTVSPDGTRIALSLAEGGRNADIWTFDPSGGSPTRITTRGENNSPVWTPDGQWLLFWSERDGIRTVYRKRSDGTGDEVRVVSGEQGRPVSVTPDGEWLTTNHRDDIWLVPIHGGEPKVMIQTPFVEGGANFSPDGQWIAYQGFESGTSTHYVRRADGEGTRMTVAPTAANAHWSRDGRELFDVEQNGTVLMARPFRDGSIGPPQRLFDFPYHFDWDVAPDGRFLVVSEAEAPRLVFVDGWFNELRALFPDR